MTPTARRMAPLLAALAMIGPFAIDTFFPAFRAMGAYFAVSPAAMQQTISLYLAAYAGMALLHGPLSDAYGRRPVVLVFVALFGLASVGAALAQDFATLLGFRVMQGLTAGAGLIIGRAIIRDCFEGAAAQKVMAQITLIFGIAPAVAPIAGGWLLSTTGHWQPLFWFLAAFAGALAVYCALALPETHPVVARTRFAPKSLVITYRTLLRDAPTRWLITAACLNFAGFFLYVASAPAFVMDVLGLGETAFAWLFVPAIGGMMVGAAVSGRLAGQRSPRQFLQLSFRWVAIAGLLNLGISTLLPPTLPWSVLPVFVLGAGIALGFPTFTLLMLDRFPGARGAASSLQTAASLLLMSVVSGVVAPLVQHDALTLALTSTVFGLAAYVAWKRARKLLDGARG